jgi:hypothetical protein
VDDSTHTCLEKFEWVLNFASSLQADILCTGDVFTHSLYSNSTRYQLKKAFKDFQKNGLVFYTCSGNHSGDVDGVDFSTVKFRELGQFILDGYINHLGSTNSGEFISDTGLFAGLSAYEDNPRLAPGYDSLVSGLVCHHWVQDAFGDSLVVYPDKLKEQFPNLKVLVAGHDHAFHDPYISRDGVLVLRPGSMMRTDSGKSSERIPGVYVWDFDKGYDVDAFSYHPIAVARPYSEVFYSERKAINAESANALDRFVRQMQENSGTVMDINSALQEQLALVPSEDQVLIRADLSAQGFLIGA